MIGTESTRQVAGVGVLGEELQRNVPLQVEIGEIDDRGKLSLIPVEADGSTEAPVPADANA